VTAPDPDVPHPPPPEFTSIPRVRDFSVQDRVGALYARFYAPLAVSLVALVAFPPFADTTAHFGSVTVEEHYGSLFVMASTPAGDPAVLGLLLLGVLVALLVAATFRVRTTGRPVAIAIISAFAALMLIVKPGTDSNAPPALSGAGWGGLLLLIGATILGVAHIVHLRRAVHAYLTSGTSAAADR
jgi:hypothetical protein